MLLETQIREEIFERINNKLGYKITEENLSPTLRQKITNLVAIRKNLLILEEANRGQKTRINNSTILRIAGRAIKNKDLIEEQNRISALKAELERGVISVADEISKEGLIQKISSASVNNEVYSVKITELKCPRCGAPLPFHDSHSVKCKYCGATLLMGGSTPR